MRKATTIITMIAGLTLGSASLARAQAPAPTPRTERVGFANISVGSQFQSRTLTINNTVSVFGEDGIVTANQTVGRGFVFDATAGHRVWRKVMGAVGISTFGGKGNAAAVAAVPDRLVFGKFSTIALNATDLKQSDIAVNFQAVWTVALSDEFDLAIFFGPSIIHVKQDLVSVNVDQATGIALATTDRQSKTTAKAGSAGVDLSYKTGDRYGVGAFVRYLGGEVSLPSASSMTIGGIQAGVGLRYRF